MKHPLQNGPALLFGALIGVLVMSASGLEADGIMPSAMGSSSTGSGSALTDPLFGTANRRGCNLGMRYSPYHRKCVLWLSAPLR
jgi:hypothetical protein